MIQYHGPVDEPESTDEQKLRRAKQLPAFPVNVYEGHAKDGMTLRDYFAVRAMEAFLTELTHQQELVLFDSVATTAYLCADAMLEARTK